MSHGHIDPSGKTSATVTCEYDPLIAYVVKSLYKVRQSRLYPDYFLLVAHNDLSQPAALTDLWACWKGQATWFEEFCSVKMGTIAQEGRQYV